MITGEQVKAARKRLGESQKAFAQRFGIDQGTLSRWETDGLPERGTAEMAVASVLRELEAAPSESSPSDLVA